MIALSAGHVVGLMAALALILAVTVFSSRSVKSSAGYSLMGRSSGPTLIAGSILGTCIGGAATIGSAQMASSIGLSAWWFTLGVGIALVILSVFYAHPLRRSRLETVPQYLGLHYGKAAEALASIISSIGILFSAVASSLSGISMVALILHIAPWQAAGLIVVLVALIVSVGGLKGAGVAGLLKMGVIAVSLCVAGVVAALDLAGMPDFSRTFPSFPWFSLVGRGWGDCLGNLTSLIVGVICTQSYIQAIFAAADAKVAARGTMVAALITIPVGLPSVAIGMYMHAAHPDLQPILALPAYLCLYLPSWLGGIGLAGLLFSVVGSIAGLALGIGTMVSNDLGRGIFHIASDRLVLRLNRLTVLAVTLLAMGISLANPDTYVLDWNYMSMALRGGGVFLPLSLAIFWPGRLSPGWAAASMAASTAGAILGRFGFGLAFNPLFVGLAVSLLLTAAGLLSAKHHPRMNADPEVSPDR